MRPLTVGSLFSGIGGLELGLERAGMEVRWQVEVDAFCRRVLARHWPHVTRYEDVREVGGHNLERVEVICGGFPCQDLSLAGKGAGLAGQRSGLWREYARIVREIRPRYVLVENVAALVARGLGDVLGDLAACGYDAEWDCIPAAALGAPHRRDRLFLVAYAQGQRLEGPRLRGRLAGGGGAPGPLAHAYRLRQIQPQGRFRDLGRWLGDGSGSGDAWATEPSMGRVAHGVPARVDRLRALGNAVVPQVAHWLGRRIVAHSEGLP